MTTTMTREGRRIPMAEKLWRAETLAANRLKHMKEQDKRLSLMASEINWLRRQLRDAGVEVGEYNQQQDVADFAAKRRSGGRTRA